MLELAIIVLSILGICGVDIQVALGIVAMVGSLFGLISIFGDAKKEEYVDVFFDICNIIVYVIFGALLTWSHISLLAGSIVLLSYVVGFDVLFHTFIIKCAD